MKISKQTKLRRNTGMPSMQELFFLLGGLRWDTLPTNVFIFVTQEEHNFQMNKNTALLPTLRERKQNPNLTVLTPSQVFYGLFSLLSKYF